jgi:peptidoglycan/LPS O-acetylase OafA/YrhL
LNRISSARYEQLDSLRGLAALTVVIHHLFLVPLALTPFFQLLFHFKSPAKLLISGHAAVLLFFVLSGFVLSLPLHRHQSVDYLPFLLKRLFRIYLPYLVSILIAMGAASLFYSGSIDGLSSWFQSSWKQPLDPASFMEHMVLIGNIHSDLYNNVIWSLIHELRISLIFPFVILLLNRSHWAASILACFVFSLIGGLNNVYHWELSNGFHTTYFDSLHYLSFFILGSLLAKHQAAFLHHYKKLSFPVKITLLLLSLLCYIYATYPTVITNQISFLAPFNPILIDYITAAGASGIIVLALSSSALSKLLLTKPLLFLGNISFSLYLYHLTVLLGLVHSLHQKLPLPVILLLSLPLSIGVSAVMWYVFERRFAEQGRALAHKLAKSPIPIKA